MSVSSIRPKTSLIDLPADILMIIMDSLSNDESLIIGPAVLRFLLTHRKFIETANQKIEKHQHYLRYRDVVINATARLPEPLEDITQYTGPQPGTASPAPNLSVCTTFVSPLMMLIEMHRDHVIADYVRSLRYVPPFGNLKHALHYSKAPLELFGGDQEALNVWERGIEAIVNDVLPDGATFMHTLRWLQGLWQQDNGQGIHMLLQMLPRLDSLSLTGPERRWSQGTDVQLDFFQTARMNISSVVRKLSFRGVSSISKSFHRHLFPSLQQIEIHCDSKKTCWVGRGRPSFLDVPQVTITGYRQNPVYLAVVIASASNARFSRLECTFIHGHPGGPRGFLTEFGDAFASPRLLLPAFSSGTGGSIKMILEPDLQFEPELLPHHSRTYIADLDAEIGRCGAFRRLDKLGPNVPVAKKLQSCFKACKRWMLTRQS